MDGMTHHAFGPTPTDGCCATNAAPTAKSTHTMIPDGSTSLLVTCFHNSNTDQRDVWSLPAPLSHHITPVNNARIAPCIFMLQHAATGSKHAMMLPLKSRLVITDAQLCSKPAAFVVLMYRHKQQTQFPPTQSAAHCPCWAFSCSHNGSQHAVHSATKLCCHMLRFFNDAAQPNKQQTAHRHTVHGSRYGTWATTLATVHGPPLL